MLDKIFALMRLFLKILFGMANSVNLDQTAPKEQSDLVLHCLHIHFVRKFCVRNCCTYYDKKESIELTKADLNSEVV